MPSEGSLLEALEKDSGEVVLFVRAVLGYVALINTPWNLLASFNKGTRTEPAEGGRHSGAVSVPNRHSGLQATSIVAPPSHHMPVGCCGNGREGEDAPWLCLPRLERDTHHFCLTPSARIRSWPQSRGNGHREIKRITLFFFFLLCRAACWDLISSPTRD